MERFRTTNETNETNFFRQRIRRIKRIFIAHRFHRWTQIFFSHRFFQITQMAFLLKAPSGRVPKSRLRLSNLCNPERICVRKLKIETKKICVHLCNLWAKKSLLPKKIRLIREIRCLKKFVSSVVLTFLCFLRGKISVNPSAKPCVYEKNGGIFWRLTKKVLILQPKTTHHFNGTIVKQVDEQKSLYMMRQAACSRTIIGYARLKGSQ